MADQINPTRVDTWRITLEVEHPVSGSMIAYGIWDTKSGGEVDSEERQYHPGGMEPPIQLGGRQNIGNVTLRRLYRLGRDHETIQQLIDGAGRCRAKIVQTPMQINGTVYRGSGPLVYTGMLKRVTPPEHDSEGNDPAFVEVEISTDVAPTKASSNS